MDRRNLTLDIRADNIGAKRVNVRSSLTVENLTATIKDKFNLDGEFRLTLQGASEPLAVDLEPVEELPTVSRHHACITEKRGQFFIEDIQGRNPVYLDGTRLREGSQHPLTAGQTIQVGRVRLTFNLMG